MDLCKKHTTIIRQIFQGIYGAYDNGLNYLGRVRKYVQKIMRYVQSFQIQSG